MSGEVDYASEVLSNLFEAVGRALPGLIAGLAIICAFLVAASLARRIFERVARGIDEGKTVLAPNSAVFGSVIIVE